MEMIDELIRSLFDNAEMTLDMMASGTPTPIFLGKGTMSCVDGTQLWVELVLDEDYLMGHSCLFFPIYISEQLPVGANVNDRTSVLVRGGTKRRIEGEGKIGTF